MYMYMYMVLFQIVLNIIDNGLLFKDVAGSKSSEDFVFSLLLTTYLFLFCSLDVFLALLL